MRKFIFTAMLAVIVLPGMSVSAQSQPYEQSWSDRQRLEDEAANRAYDRKDRRQDARQADRRYKRQEQRQQRRAAWQDYNRYDYDRFDRRHGSYQADRYYRDGRYYQQRRLTNDDRIYRGSNGRYYCRRNDGTTGLIIGAVGGSLLGRAIAPNGSNTLGTILGGAGGALIGRSIGRDGVRCN
jgi:Glycine zipper 2TM domain